MWVPIPFEKSFRMAYSRTHYGTGYYIYHQFVRGARLSQDLHGWDAKTAPDDDVIDLIDRAGTDLVTELPVAGYSNRECQVVTGQRPLDAQAATLARSRKPLRCCERWIFPCRASRRSLSVAPVCGSPGTIGPSHPIDAPVALFFGAGTLYNRDGREYLVKAFPVHIRFDERARPSGLLLPDAVLPLGAHRVEKYGAHEVRWTSTGAFAMRLIAIRRSTSVTSMRPTPIIRDPSAGKDLVLLDTKAAEGGGDWSGQFVGTSFIFSHRADLTTLGGRSAFLLRRQPDAAGPGHRDRGVGRRRRLLGRPQR